MYDASRMRRHIERLVDFLDDEHHPAWLPVSLAMWCLVYAVCHFFFGEFNV